MTQPEDVVHATEEVLAAEAGRLGGQRGAQVLRSLVLAVVPPVIAIAIALVITSVILAVSGNSLVDFWSIMLDAPNQRDLVNIANQASMLFLSGAAAAIAFRMNLFNIGVEGQYAAGAYAAAVFAGAALVPGPLNILASLVVAIAVGAGVAGIAGVLKVTRGVSEVISTIMLNTIVLTLIGWHLSNYGEQYGTGRRTTPIPESSRLVGIQVGQYAIWSLAVLAVIVGVGLSVLISRTRFGFDLRATGANEEAAVASGVHVKRMVVVAMLLSGGVAGLIWMPALFGGADYYGPPFQPMLGFTGIAVALLGRNTPIGIAFGALLFAWLDVAAGPLDVLADISPSIVDVTQGVVVLAVVIGYELFRRWLTRREQRQLERALERRESRIEEVIA